MLKDHPISANNLLSFIILNKVASIHSIAYRSPSILELALILDKK